LIRAGKDYFKNFGMLCTVLGAVNSVPSFQGILISSKGRCPSKGRVCSEQALPFIISANELKV
jgi:hypothetical protein